MRSRFQNRRIFGTSQLATTFALALALMFVSIVFSTPVVHAQTFTVLHSFTGGGGGANPYAGLSRDGAGNLYGTVATGGYSGGSCAASGGCGLVFKLEYKGSGWLLTPLYTFRGGSDGSTPNARVIIGPSGILYGTTRHGGGSGCGGNGCGTVFSLRPSASACVSALCSWNETVIYRFTGGSDGANPGYGDLVFDAADNIYGTTISGGEGSCEYGSGCGVIYKLAPSGSGWTESVLYTFAGGSGGGNPFDSLVFDSTGDLYGTAATGGNLNCNAPYGCGTVFELATSVSGWTENVLYTFQNGTDGASPYGGLIFDPSGNLYGTTPSGGSGGGGTVFKLTPLGGSWTFGVVYSFVGSGSLPGPYDDLTMDSAGNVYGTTYQDGANGVGNVFELIPVAGAWAATSLHDFTNGSDGSNPSGGVVLDASGNLYSTAANGGADGEGVVFEIAPSPNFALSATPASLTVQQGNQGTSTITSTVLDGFSNSITLSTAGVPSGTTVTFNPNPIPPPGSGNSTMTITVGASTATGTYPITITGNGGGVQQSTTLTLTVTEQQLPSFTLSANPTSVTVQQGNQGTSTITSTISGGFNSAITLSASGVPSGTSVNFNPNPIPAPGSGNSTMTITVGASTATGTYPITVTGNGGGVQQNTTLTLTVTAAGGWAIGFDFRATSNYVTDPPGDTYVLASTSYPTSFNGTDFGWANTNLVQASNRSTQIDPRLAGINYATNGSPAIFLVNLPSAGTYNLSLAMGDAGYPECWVQCQIQFLDGNTVLATITEGLTDLGYFYDAQGNNWSAAQWPTSNISQEVTLQGTQLKVVVGTNQSTGDLTPIAFLGVAQAIGLTPNFNLSASPTSLTIAQGNQGTATITTTISGGFDSPISLSAAGIPSGTTVSFSPNPIPAPGAGSSTMTITVGASTLTGTYPITITGNGAGVQQNTTVTLTVASSPEFLLMAAPASLTVQQGNQGTSTITSTISGGFDSSVSLSASGGPSGTTVSFNPQTIPAPGSGNSTMTITVGASTPLGSYPITVTGNGGGIQQNTTVTLTVTSSAAWYIGFDFRASSNYVTDPPGDTYVLSSTAYPTTFNGTNYGWTDTNNLQGRDRSTQVDPRLAGINYALNGTPGVFYVDLPASGTYNVSLAMGDEGYPECSVQCQIQFLDGNTVVGTVAAGPINLGYFYDAQENLWSASQWPTQNVSREVAISGTRLTVVVGTSDDTGDQTPIAFLGLTQVTLAPNFLLSAAPASLSVTQGNQGSSTVTTNISGGFNSAISLSAAGAPAGTTVSFNPNPIPAPGAGSSTVTFSVGASTGPGTYPITVTGNGGGVQQTATITLTVTAAAQPSFILTVSPPALAVAQGSVGNTTAMTMPLNGFDSSIGLAASGMPAGVTVSFNPQTIPAPGGGTSTMTITVAANTALGTYPITVTGNGGGIQQNATLQLSVISSVWTQGFDFRGSQGFVSDPPGDTDVLLTTVFPTTGNLTTYGWSYTAVFAAADRNNMLDPRLAGINYVTNGTPGSFYVNLPTPGTYSLSLAMGDAGSQQCFTRCQIQFFDGNTLLATVSGGLTNQAYFYDMQGNNWSAAQWPTNNVPQQVTLAGTQLTVTMGLSQYNGDVTPIAFLGVTQVSTGPTFALQAPTTVSVGQGQYSTADVFTVLIGAFNSAINLSASGGPAGTTISFNPATIPAPGAGTSIMTITVPSGAALGSYPITVTAQGGGIIQHATVWLNVTVADPPAFTLTAPSAVSSASSGGQVTGTITTTAADGFNSAISLSAAGAPQGTTVSFNPSTIPAPGSGSSVMSGNVAAGTPYGSYAITVTASSAQGNQTATVTLTVSASGQVNLPAGTGWVALGPDSNFCNVSPGYTYYNPDVGEIDAFDFLSNCIGGEMVAYGGGAADTGNERYYLWTSGHGNYQGNEMYLLNLEGANGPTAVRITDPDWTVDNTDVPADCACKGTNNCGQGMWHNGVGYQVSNPYSESGYGGPLFESTPAPDGSAGQPSCGYGSRFTPNAREDYAGLVYNPPLNQLFTWGGAAAADPTGLMYSNWTLNLNHQPPQWTRLQNNSYAWFTAAVYDYTTGHSTSGDDLVFDENRTLYAYNPANDTYTVLDNTLPYIGYNANLDLDPLDHYLVMENGDEYGGYHLRILYIDTCNGSNCHITNLDSTASCAGALGYWAGITWDSKRDVMAIFPSSTNCSGAGCTPPFQTVYLLNPDPNNPVTITYQGQQQTIGPQQCFAASYGPTPPTSFGPGVYSRFKYYPNEDIYLYIPNPTSPWILRLEQ